MTTTADWMVVAGFLLAVFGLSLRIFMMMRSSDAHPADAALKDPRSLMRTYSTTFPKSRLPLVMWIALTAGPLLLIVGFSLELR
jgi:hypothetical protein